MSDHHHRLGWDDEVTGCRLEYEDTWRSGSEEAAEVRCQGRIQEKF